MQNYKLVGRTTFYLCEVKGFDIFHFSKTGACLKITDSGIAKELNLTMS
jgi:hypothetical protein